MSQATLDIDPTRIVQAEGNSGATPFVFTVTRTGDTSIAAAANWSVPAASFPTANDFVGDVLPSGVVSFAPGETTQTITVNVQGDTITPEYNENFAVTLSGPTLGTVIGPDQGHATIMEDDGFTGLRLWAIGGSQTFFSSALTQYEGNSGATPFVYAIIRAGDLSSAASVAWSTAGTSTGSDPADAADFVGGVLPSGTASFAAGQALALITVDVQGDTAYELTEGFAVTLSNPVGAALSTVITAGGTITNDDLPVGGAVGITPYVVSHPEGGSGAVTDFVYTLSRVGDTTPAATVTWSVQSLSGATGFSGAANYADAADFVGDVLPSGTASFAEGQTTQTITVEVAGDNTVEPGNDLFFVQLDTATGTTIGGATNQPVAASGTITNDDSDIFIQQYPGGLIYEGNTASHPVVYRVYRNGYTATATEIAWQVTGYGAAQADGADFAGGVLPSGTISFAPGVASQDITLDIAGDTTVEADEGFQISLATTDPNVTIDNSITGTILNDDRTLSIAANSADKPEGDSGATPFTFTVTRSAVSHETGATDIVKWAVGGYGANPVNAADFLNGIVPSGTLSFAAGVLSQTITVFIQGDTIAEPDEQFRVLLYGATTGETIVDAQAIGTVRNDDGVATTGTVSIATSLDPRPEGNTGATDHVYTITRTGDTSTAATVVYSVTGEPNLIDGGAYYPTTAANAADFVGGVLPSGTISFAAGQTTQSLTIAVQGDSQVEPDETFLVSLSNPSGAVLGGSATAIGSIFNDDSYVYLDNGDPNTPTSGYEGNGAGIVVFNLHRVGGDTLGGTVEYTVTGSGANPAPASAFAGGVYPTGTFSFAAGVGDQYVTIAMQGDSLPASDEGFTITLSNPSAGMQLDNSVHPTSAGYTILNDDSAIAITATDATKAEGNSGSTPFVFTVTRTAISGPDLSPAITLVWSTGSYGGNPVNAADFAGGIVPSGTLSFAAGQLSQALTVNIQGDTTPEANEQFRVVLSGAPSGTTITTAQAIGTVLNDDINFAVTANTASQNEGNSGTTAFVFTITRAGGTDTDTGTGTGTDTDSVGWALVGAASGNSANAADFAAGQAMSGRVSFGAGQTTQLVTVLVQGDTAVEPDEGFRLLLQGASAGTRITTGSAQATILNDDTGLAVAPLDAVKYEGDTGQTAFTFTISRTGLLSAGDTVNWAVIGAASGASANAADFLGSTVPTGTVSFAAGQSSAIVTVEVQGDQIVEPDEGFQLVLGGAHAGAGNGAIAITTARAGGTILNDDTGLAIAAVNPVQNEGNSGATNYVFTVTRTGTLAGSTTADWLVTGLAPNSVGPADFVTGAPLAGTVSFVDGQSRANITISVQGDTQVEPDEHFRVLLRNATPGATITQNHADATILNDDPAPAPDIAAPSFAIAALSADKNEGNSGRTPFTFTITRSGDTTGTNTVAWTASTYGTDTVNAADFSGNTVNGALMPAGTLTFAPGDTSATITINVAGDTTIEPDETFQVALSSPGGGAVIGTGTAIGTIVNDDSGYGITRLDAVKYEGNAGSTPFTFTVTRYGPLTATASTVTWSVFTSTPGNVAAQSDFTGNIFPSGTLSFAAGQVSQVITVNVAGDRIAEPNETFSIGLGNGQVNTTGIIVNDDNSVTAAPLTGNGTVTEGTGGTTDFVFTVTRTGYSTAYAMSVDWAVLGDTSNGVAAGAADFTGPLTGTLSFAAGEVQQTVTVGIAADSLVEPNEAFRLHLANPSDSSHPTDSIRVDIIDDDSGFSIATVSGNTTTEGQTQHFAITRSGLLTTAETVDWHVYGTGANPAGTGDFTGAISGTATFGVGHNYATIDVAVLDDRYVEPNDQFTIMLTNPSGGASIVTGHVDSSITNNDVSLSITATDATKLEGNGLKTPFVFNIARTGNTAAPASLVHWIVSGSGANPANAGDFLGRVTSGSLYVGGAGANLTLDVAGDTVVEPDESFSVLIQLDPASQSDATIAVNHATGTILNDDTAPAPDIAADLLPTPAPLASADVAPSGAGGASDPYSAVAQSAPLLAWPTG